MDDIELIRHYVNKVKANEMPIEYVPEQYRGKVQEILGLEITPSVKSEGTRNSNYCVNCGKKLSFFSGNSKLWKGAEGALCDKCKEEFDRYSRQHQEEDPETALNQLKDYGFTEAGIQYIYDYYLATNKIADEFKDSIRNKIAADYETEIENNRKRDTACENMLITSGFTFEGYRIVKYSGYISGDDVIQIPRKYGANGELLTAALAEIRCRALKELKEAAYDLGCNAVIGVDFDYLTLEPEYDSAFVGNIKQPYMICVTANGNAVRIEKIQDE